MLHMQCFVSPPIRKPGHVTCPQPLALCIFSPTVTSSIYTDTFLYQTQQTLHTAVYMIYHTNTCRWFWSGRWWCGSAPKQASAGSVTEARGWPSATGWLQRRRHWASPRQKEIETQLYLNVSFVDGHNWMAFMIILKYQTRREIHGWVITLTFQHKSKKKGNFVIFKNFCKQTWGFDVA